MAKLPNLDDRPLSQEDWYYTKPLKAIGERVQACQPIISCQYLRPPPAERIGRHCVACRTPFAAAFAKSECCTRAGASVHGREPQASECPGYAAPRLSSLARSAGHPAGVCVVPMRKGLHNGRRVFYGLPSGGLFLFSRSPPTSQMPDRRGLSRPTIRLSGGQVFLLPVLCHYEPMPTKSTC